MAISPLRQVTLLAAPEFDLGLATGELIRSGGVIRNQAGEIVARLEEAGVSLGNAASKAASKAAAVARDNKGKAIIVGVTVAGTAAYVSHERMVNAKSNQRDGSKK